MKKSSIISNYIINRKNEFVGLSWISKIVVGLIVIVILYFSFSSSSKFYKYDEIIDDLFIYESEVINNGTVIGKRGGFLYKSFGLPVDDDPYTIEFYIQNGKVVGMKEYSDKRDEKIKIQTVDGSNFFRYNQLIYEFKNNKFFEYFIDGSIKNECEGYFEGRNFIPNGICYEYDEKGNVVEQFIFKEGKEIE